MAKAGHLNIMFVVDRLSPGRKLSSSAAGQCPSVLMFAAGFYGGPHGWDEYRFEVTSPGLGCPPGIHRLAPILSLAICGRAAGAMIRAWRRKP